MTTDCSLNYEFSKWKFQAQNMLRTCCDHKLFFVLTFRTNPQYDWRPIVHWITSSVNENSKLRTCWEHAVITNCFLFWHSEQFMHTTCFQHVLNMFWAWNFHVLNSKFKEQSFVILCVSWYKNKCFWKRFTCMYLQNLVGI